MHLGSTYGVVLNRISLSGELTIFFPGQFK